MATPSHAGLTERQALMILSALPDFGPITVRRLQAAIDQPVERIFELGKEDLGSLLSSKRAAALLEWEQHFDLVREEERLVELDARFVIPGDADYPPLLGKLIDAPLGLYQRGPRKVKGPAIAIVGTRYASQYGLKVTRQLTTELVSAGFTIVSGLALGIDTEAHRTALEMNGSTVAVLGNGVDRLYPPQNRALFGEMLQRGALFSEFYLGRKADRQTFPQRNRIVSGMTDATLVVESASRGGSLITARFAMEQNRTVFAVPGRLDQPGSRGCLELIRDGATLVTSAEDILEELRFMQLDLPLQTPGPEKTATKSSGFSAPASIDEQHVAAALEGERLHPDQICDRSELASHQVHAALMMLELQRRVARNADGTYELLG